MVKKHGITLLGARTCAEFPMLVGPTFASLNPIQGEPLGMMIEGGGMQKHKK